MTNTLKLFEPIAAGGLGRWLTAKEYELFLSITDSIKTKLVRVKRDDRKNDRKGHVIYCDPATRCWKKAGIEAEFKKKSDVSHPEAYAASQNHYIEDEYGLDVHVSIIDDNRS